MQEQTHVAQETIIDLQGVSKEYRDIYGEVLTVLDLASFQVTAGEIVALTGKSGSGKTTLINIVAGILAPTKGRVQVSGEAIYNLTESGRDRFRAEHIGYVFQSYNLIPSLSAYDNIMCAMYFGRRIDKKERDIRCKNLLELVGLSRRGNHLPSELSGGEQQRVSVARALANHPRILLADEPTANLDASNREAIMELLFALREQEQLTILMSSHDDDLAARADRVVQLESSESLKSEKESQVYAH